MKLAFNGHGRCPFTNDTTIADLVSRAKADYDAGKTDVYEPIVPSYTSDVESAPRIATVQFGDGYSQRTPEGINSLALKFNLIFGKREKRVVTAIEKFLAGDKVLYLREPHEYFFWTPPAPHRKRIKVVCLKWKTVYDQYNQYTLTATFDQVFDP